MDIEKFIAMKNDEFQSIHPMIFEMFTPEEQYRLLFNKEYDRIGVITKEQMLEIKSETLLMFIDDSKLDKRREQQLHKFIGTIDFNYLTIENFTIIFIEKKNWISKNQIQNIELKKLMDLDYNFFIRFINSMFYNFSFPQLILLTKIDSLSYTTINKTLISLLEIIKDYKTFGGFNATCTRPNEFPLTSSTLSSKFYIYAITLTKFQSFYKMSLSNQFKQYLMAHSYFVMKYLLI